jgi:MFS transporter, ACS family, D-galactonate transporter
VGRPDVAYCVFGVGCEPNKNHDWGDHPIAAPPMVRESTVDRVSRPNSQGAIIIAVLLGCSAFLNYLDRGNLSIAAPLLKDELGISPAELGVLLSAFFWSYACAQPLAGWLVDRLNVNWVLGTGFIIWSAATALTGTAHAFALLLALRLVLGLGESIAFPSYSKIIALNFPEQSRGFANSVVSAGMVLGPGLGILFGGLLMARYGWRPFFFVLGLASLLWVVPWLIWAPSKHHAPLAHGGSTIPRIAEILRLRPFWGTCAGLFASNYVNYFLITWLPYFLVRERHFAMDDMAKLGGIAYLAAGCCSLFAGRLSDRWVVAGASPSLVRKTFIAGGLALSGVFLGIAAVSGTAVCAAALVFGVMSFAVASSNLWAITQTLAGPAAAGRWAGMQNFMGNLAGVVAPALTGWILGRTGQFYWAFVIMVGVVLIGVASWVFVVGRVEPVIWHRKTATALSA